MEHGIIVLVVLILILTAAHRGIFVEIVESTVL